MFRKKSFVVIVGRSLLNFNIAGPFKSRKECVDWLEGLGYVKGEEAEKDEWQEWELRYERSDRILQTAIIRDVYLPNEPLFRPL